MNAPSTLSRIASLTFLCLLAPGPGHAEERPLPLNLPALLCNAATSGDTLDKQLMRNTQMPHIKNLNWRHSECNDQLWRRAFDIVIYGHGKTEWLYSWDRGREYADWEQRPGAARGFGYDNAKVAQTHWDSWEKESKLVHRTDILKQVFAEYAKVLETAAKAEPPYAAALDQYNKTAAAAAELTLLRDALMVSKNLDDLRAYETQYAAFQAADKAFTEAKAAFDDAVKTTQQIRLWRTRAVAEAPWRDVVADWNSNNGRELNARIAQLEALPGTVAPWKRTFAKIAEVLTKDGYLPTQKLGEKTPDKAPEKAPEKKIGDEKAIERVTGGDGSKSNDRDD